MKNNQKSSKVYKKNEEEKRRRALKVIELWILDIETESR
jgi:hypothetical protein